MCSLGKDISLERLHYHVSTNLALLQANLTYMHAKFGISYHWIPELYRRMKLPVFDGVQEALERRNVQRKRGLDRAKTTPVKKRRIELKRRRVVEGFQRSEWTKTHGRDAYGGHESDHDKVVKGNRGKAKPRKAKPKGESVCGACGSSTHKRRTHRDCPFNTKRSTAKTSTKPVIVAVDSPSQSSDAVSDVHSVQSETGGIDSSDVHSVQSETGGIDSDDYMMYDLCTCGNSGRAHKSDCLMNFRRRHLPQSPGESKPDTARSPSPSNPGPPSVSPEPECVVIDDVSPPPTEQAIKVGDYVSVHSRGMGSSHLQIME